MSVLTKEEQKAVIESLNKSADFSNIINKVRKVVSDTKHREMAKKLLEYSKLHNKKLKGNELSPEEKSRKVTLKNNIFTYLNNLA